MNYLCFSGGADSTALAILLVERGEDFSLLFCDTGAELPETYWIIPHVAKALDRKLIVVSGPTMFQQLCNRNFFLPGPRVRWCTQELKEKPLNAAVKTGDVFYVGIRADEDHRAHVPKNAVKGVEYDWPLVEAGLGKKEVLALCESHGLLNPCYNWRSSCSCFCCPFQKKADWLNLSKQQPDLYAIAEEWEAQSMANSQHTKHTWNESFSLRQLREGDEAQVRLWPEPKEEACSICRW